ncbi:MAG: SurA N-terminal domain-containing protein [bacterium]
MLYFMRNYMKSFVMWLIIAAFVLTIFYAWGMKSARLKGGTKNWLAKVGNETISVEEYEKEYRRTMEQFRDVPPELMKQLNLKQQVLDKLVNQQILVDNAGKMGIEAGDKEVAASIEAIQAFQENGAFSSQSYQAILSQNRLTPAFFESQQRKMVVIQKLQKLIQDSAKVTDDEIHDAYVHKNEKITADYALITFQNHRPQENPSEQELEKYFSRHKDDFRTQEQVNVIFSTITPQDLFNEIQVPEEEINKFYSVHSSEFIQPAKVHARHILIRVPDDAGKETEKASREKMINILKEARGGTDFASLAIKYSEDSTASRGGDLGFFGPGAMTSNFERAAFALNPGEISPVVRTPFGFHIIKVEERQDDKKKTLNEVRDEILLELKTDSGIKLARKKARLLYAEIHKTKDFRKTLGEAKIPVRETGFFSRKDTLIQGVPADINKRFSEEAFSAGEEGIGGVIKGENEYILLQVFGRKAPGIPPLNEVRQAVVEAALQEKGKSNAESNAKNIVQSLLDKTPFNEAAVKAGLKDTGTTEPFTRDQTVMSPDFVKTAFTLSPEKPAAYIPAENGFYVIALKEKQPADETAFQAVSEEIKKALLQGKRETMFISWLNQARKDAGINVNQELLDKM